MRTEDEYLAFERRSEVKHEFVNGEVVAMTGASWKHNVICANTSAALHIDLEAISCTLMLKDVYKQGRILACMDYRAEHVYNLAENAV